MKARTRRGHDGHDRTNPGSARCVRLCPRLHERSTLPVPPASQSLVCFRWPFHAAFPANSGRTFFIGALSVVSRVVRVFMSVVLCLSVPPRRFPEIPEEPFFSVLCPLRPALSASS